MSEIDVSKCEFITRYDDCRICNGKSLRLHCRDNINCYYKQLQQAKADVEKAKKYNYNAGQQLIRMSQELQQLKVENKKLRFPREDIDFAVLTKEEFENYNKLKADNEELKKLKDEILNKKPSEREYCKGCTLPAYSKCLDEIEELQKELCRRCDLTFCGNTVCYEILQKIKQAKEGE